MTDGSIYWSSLVVESISMIKIDSATKLKLLQITHPVLTLNQAQK